MLILGAGGHALELLDALDELNQLMGIQLFEEGIPLRTPTKRYGLNVITGWESAAVLLQSQPDFLLGVGSPVLRTRLCAQAEALGGKNQTLLSPRALISSEATVDAGCTVLAFAYIAGSSHLGEGTLVGVGAQIHHEVVVGRFCEVGPGTQLLGQASIGDSCQLGANATVLPGVAVGAGAIVGAGSVVVSDVSPGSTVMGVPARVPT